MGHLAWADAFVITADSVSMLSEACSTGYVAIYLPLKNYPFPSLMKFGFIYLDSDTAGSLSM